MTTPIMADARRHLIPCRCVFGRWGRYARGQARLQEPGHTDQAGNFRCGGNLDKNPVAVCKMLRANYKHENEDVLNFRETDLARDELNCLKESQEPADHYRVDGFGPAGRADFHDGQSGLQE